MSPPQHGARRGGELGQCERGNWASPAWRPRETARIAGDAVRPASEVLVASTGVIGVQLPWRRSGSACLRRRRCYLPAA